VDTLKNYISSQNQGSICVSAEIIKKAVMRPEEGTGVEPRMDRMQSLENKFYPKPAELLLENPFAVPKVAKKAKKKKKK
jgi:hypothetical protein